MWARIQREEAPQAARIAEWMKAHHDKQGVLDVGCGPGTYVEAMVAAGVPSLGVDNDPRCPYGQTDITSEMMTPVGYDVVLSLEVGEHIDPSKADAYVDYICRAKPSVIYFSAAASGQGGEGHINCQPKEYWRELFRDRGYIEDLMATEVFLRFMTAGPHMGWLANNAMVFRAPI